MSCIEMFTMQTSAAASHQSALVQAAEEQRVLTQVRNSVLHYLVGSLLYCICILIQELHESLVTDITSLLQKALEKQSALLKSSTNKVRNLAALKHQSFSLTFGVCT